MRTVSSLLVVVALALGVASVPVIGGVIFALFVFWPLLLLGLVGLLSSTGARTVPRREPRLSPRGWRDPT